MYHTLAIEEDVLVEILVVEVVVAFWVQVNMAAAVGKEETAVLAAREIWAGTQAGMGLTEDRREVLVQMGQEG